MKKIVFLPLVLISMLTFSQSTTYNIPEEDKRIVFLGNSITYTGYYIAYIEAYYKLKYPERTIEFINLGLPSETVSQLSEPDHADGKFRRPKLQERLKRVLKKLKPDLVFSFYGINDGIYLPFDEGRFDKFKKGIYWLHNRVNKAGVPIIYMTPSIYDNENGAAYANVMDIYSDWLMSRLYTMDWNVIDIHNSLKQKIANNRAVNPYYRFAIDGVHPTKDGHWLIANQLLIAFGELDRMQDSFTDCFSSSNKAKKVLALVERKQAIQKNAWLTATKHKRPEMKIGLPMEQAVAKIKVLDAEIETIVVK